MRNRKLVKNFLRGLQKSPLLFLNRACKIYYYFIKNQKIYLINKNNMIFIDNSQNISSTLVYGAPSAEKMTLKNMQTNEEFDIELFDTSPEERYGIFQFLYNENLQLNSGEVIDGTTNFNMVPGKYIYTIGDLIGILYFKELKNNVIIYDQTNESTIYKG